MSWKPIVAVIFFMLLGISVNLFQFLAGFPAFFIGVYHDD